MYKGLESAGVPNDSPIYALEPSCGTGKFLALAPKNYIFEVVEKDIISANITKLLFPDVCVHNCELRNADFKREFDVVIGNPPYETTNIYDSNSSGNSLSIHNYFAVKASEVVKDNGIISFVISSYFLDGKDKQTRSILMDKQNCDLLKAVRLPNSAFKSTHTEVLTDIVYLQKLNKKEIENKQKSRNGVKYLQSTSDIKYKQDLLFEQYKKIHNNIEDNQDYSLYCNTYYAETENNILGDINFKIDRFGKVAFDITERKDFRKELKENLELIPKVFGLNPPKVDRSSMLIPFELMPTEKEREKVLKLFNGNCFECDGKIYRKDGDYCHEVYFEESKEKEYLSSVERDNIIEIKNTKFTYKKYLNEEEIKILKNLLEFRDLLKENLELEKTLPNDIESNALILEQKAQLREMRRNILLSVKPKSKKIENCYFNDTYRSVKDTNGNIVRENFQKILSLEKIDSYRILATENIKQINKNGKLAKETTLSDVLYKRISYPLEKTLATTSEEALQKTMLEKGKIDLDTLQFYLPSKNIKEIVKELVEMKLVYPNIFDESEPLKMREVFLSGNVKANYQKVQDFIEDNKDFGYLGIVKDFVNLSEIANDLKEVFPKNIDFTDINISFGAYFVEQDIYIDFLKRTYFTDPESIIIKMSKEKGFYKIDSIEQKDGTPVGKSDYTDEANNFEIKHTKLNADGEEIFTENIWCDFREFINKVLQNKSLEVSHTEPNKDGVLDSKGELKRVKVIELSNTRIAMQNAELVKTAFTSFLYEQPEYQGRIEKKYNDTVNVFSNLVLDYDKYLHTPFLSKDITLRPHQKNAIFKGIMQNSLMLDHQVGAGKTLACIALTMEQKRMGLIKKALILVPNHLAGQWGVEFFRAYPNANILVADNIQSKKERKEFLYRARYGDFDAIILKHSTFENMHVLDDYQIKMLEDSKDEIEESERQNANENISKKDLDKKIEKKQSKIQKKIEGLLEAKQFDDEFTLEDLGCDAFFVDEIQEFKNLSVNTAQEVKGLPQTQSIKAVKMFCMTQYIHDNNKKLYLATGTPVSNSIAEMFVMQKFLQPQALKDLGLWYFDDWQKTFTTINTVEELDSTGVNYTVVSRLNKFINVPELINLYKQNADVITNEDIQKLLNEQNFVPKLKGGKPQNIILPKSPLQELYIGIESDSGSFNENSLCWRAEHFHADPKNNNMLKILSDGAKASLDYRLIDPTALDYENSKVNACVKRVKEHYDDGKYPLNTQLIFCDLGVSKSNSQSIDVDTYISEEKFETIEEIAKREGLFLVKFGDELVYAEIYNSKTEKKVTNEKELSFVVDEVTGEEYYETKENQEVMKIYSATQLLEMDSKFDVYSDILKKLVKSGIPQNEIAFIGDAKTDKQKQALFDKVNAGVVRVLIGSTQKMGAGTNVQKKVIAMHELTCPYRPSDLAQRQGRVIRQGNEWFEKYGKDFEIASYRYATEGTLDARMYQINESKIRAINQIRSNTNNGREAESIDEETLAIADMKAEATGNPFIIEQQKIDRLLLREEMLYRRYQNQIIQYKKEIQTLEFNKEFLESQINCANQLALIKLEPNFEYEAFGIKTNRRAKSESKEAKEKWSKANQGIQKAFNEYIDSPCERAIIMKNDKFNFGFITTWDREEKYSGKYTMQGFFELNNERAFTFIPKNLTYKRSTKIGENNDPIDFKGIMIRIDNAFKNMPNSIVVMNKELQETQEDLRNKRDFLVNNRPDNYSRTPLLNILKKDKVNIRQLNQNIRKIKKEFGVSKIDEDHEAVKPFLPQYKNYIDENGNLIADLPKDINEQEKLQSPVAKQVIDVEKSFAKENSKVQDKTEPEKQDKNDDLEIKAKNKSIPFEEFVDRASIEEKMKILTENMENIQAERNSKDVFSDTKTRALSK